MNVFIIMFMWYLAIVLLELGHIRTNELVQIYLKLIFKNSEILPRRVSIYPKFVTSLTFRLNRINNRTRWAKVYWKTTQIKCHTFNNLPEWGRSGKFGGKSTSYSKQTMRRVISWWIVSMTEADYIKHCPCPKTIVSLRPGK